jgi:hypothetical protein
MGLANSGEIAAMSPGYASEGTYTSPVLDATQVSRFGKVQLRGTLPSGTTLSIATRSGNIEEASAPGWSAWSNTISAAQFVQVPSPPARFFQYRLTFAGTGDGRESPVVGEVDVAYQLPNLPPKVQSVRVGDDESQGGAAGAGAVGMAGMNDGAAAEQDRPRSSKLTIAWDASDPNEDGLEYSLHFRSGTRGPWILLKDKLKDPTFEWETRNVADGRYQIKVEAQDIAGNPVGLGRTTSRVSDPVVVDNTAPVIGDVNVNTTGAEARLGMKIVDRASTVDRVDYSVDSASDWQTVLPSDSIADAPEEAYEFVVPGLSPGAHQITVRATDKKGNRAYESMSITIDKK